MRRRSGFCLVAVLALWAGSHRELEGAQSAGPADAQPDWWAETRRRIAGAEYEVTWQERPIVPALAPSWHAPNRAHGFRTFFAEDGPRVVPRTEDQPSWRWGVRLMGVGRGETLIPPGPAVLTPSANRITYDRGPIVEWYVDDADALPVALRKGRSKATGAASMAPGREGDRSAADALFPSSAN